MRQIRILHISDLHISQNQIADQKIIIRALTDDLSAQRMAGEQIDQIYFTGDLIAKGAYSQENIKLLREEFIAPLLAATKIDARDLFIVPGNHDLQTDKIPFLIRPAFDNLKSTELVSEALDNLDKYEFFTSGFAGFNGLSITTRPPIFENKLFRAYKTEVAGVSIGICALNSAWLASGSSADQDYGKLIVGQRQVDMLLDAVRDCDLRFALLHHPTQWLRPFDGAEVQKSISRDFHAVFFGHNHSADTSSIASPVGRIFSSNAGCLYQSRKYFNGYTIVTYEIATSAWKVSVREYFDARQCFDASNRFGSNGQAVFVGYDANKSLTPSPSGEYIEKINEFFDSHLLPSTISSIAPKSLARLFVEPRLGFVSERQLSKGENGRQEQVELISLKDAVDSSASIVFIGQKESGKTTILHRICSESSGLTFADGLRFGCYVDLQRIKKTKAGILDAIVNYSGGTYLRSDFISFLEQGLVTLCFDNLTSNDNKLNGAIKEFIDKYPNNRYIFSMLESFTSSIVEDQTSRFGLGPQKNIYIHSFGRRETRALITNWFNEPQSQTFEKVELMTASMRRLNVVRTPFIVSVFLWIQEKNIAFHPVNQSEVIDIFLDGLLDKLYESKLRADIDATFKRHFLSALAFSMWKAKKNQYAPNELEVFAANYFRDKGLLSSSGEFVQELKRVGILMDSGDAVSFKFDCLRAFFLATMFGENAQFLQQSLNLRGLVDLQQEFNYFTGKNRARSDVLSMAIEVVDQAFLDLDIELPLSIFDSFSAEGSPFTDEQKEQLTKLVLGDRPTPEARESILDRYDDQLPRSPSDKQGPVGSAAEFVEALRTVSMILRNSELIDDSELKSRSYDRVNVLWCQLMLVFMAAIELSEESKPKSVLLSLFNSVLPERREYLVRILVPNIIFGVVLETLGTSKLEKFIADNISGSEKIISKLLSVMLYVDLGLPKCFDHIRKLSEIDGAPRFLLEVLLMKVLMIYLFKQISEDDARSLKVLAGDIFSRIHGARDRSSRTIWRSKLMQTLERKRLLKQGAVRPSGSEGDEVGRGE